MALALRVVSHSEVGLVRKNNQDSGYASPHLVVVADGMGGAAAGDLASAVAVDTLMRRVRKRANRPLLKTANPRATLEKLIDTGALNEKLEAIARGIARGVAPADAWASPISINRTRTAS